jgi:hypothetical protein
MAQLAPRPGDTWATVETYCFDCHNSLDLAGDRAFDQLSPEHIAANAEVWETAIRKLRAGYMPPPGAPRPEGEELTRLADWLIDEIDSAAAATAPGRVSLRRLNRREYEYAIRDLLALNVDAEDLLPEDNREGHFDNNADALQVSPAFVDQYIFAARDIAIEAIGDLDAPPVTTTYGDIANMVISLNPRGERLAPRVRPERERQASAADGPRPAPRELNGCSAGELAHQTPNSVQMSRSR